MVDAAVLRARVEVAGVQQAQQQLRGLGTQINTVGQQSGQAGQQVDQAGQRIGRAGQQAGAAGQRFTGLRQGIAQISPVALGTAGAVVGVGMAAKQAMDSSIEWESSLAGVAKTMDDTGLSAAGFDQAVADIGTEIRNMAMEIPIAATELAGVAEAAGQLGVARGDVVEFTETMALLGVATDLTAEQSATAIARISNITGLATEDVDRFGSALVDLGNNSAATESEILGMATRIAAAGNQAGLTEGEILGLAASLTSVGINAEAGGTAIVQVMNEITTAVATGSDELDVFAELAGQSAEEFAASWRANPNEALVDFIEGLGRVTAAGGDTVLVLDELGLDGIRVSQALNSAAGAGDLLRDSMDRGNTAFADNNALLEEAERRFETTASQIQIARNRINDAAITIGDAFTPALADALVGLSNFTTAFVDAFSQDDFTNVVTQWESDLEDLGTAASNFPDPPEAKADRWEQWIDRIAQRATLPPILQAGGYGSWSEVWDDMFPDEDRFAEFQDVPLPEVTDEHIERLQEIISLYENTPSRVRTVTEAEYEHAQAMLTVIERHQEFAAMTQEERDAIDSLVEGFLNITQAAFNSGDAVVYDAEQTRFLTENKSDLNRALEDGTEWNEKWHASNENVVDVMIELHDANVRATESGHRHNQMIADTSGTLADAVNQYDEVAVAAGTLERVIGNVGAVTSGWRAVVDESKAGAQLWTSDIKENEEAIAFLDEQLAKNNITAEEHAQKVETLEWWNRRLESGVESMTGEWADNRVAAAEVTREMEDLEEAYKNGDIKVEEYEKRSAELREEWERQSDPLVNLIEKIDELITKMFGLDEADASPEVDVSTVDGHRAIDVIGEDLDDLDSTAVEAEVDVSTAAGHRAVDILRADIERGAMMPLTIVANSQIGFAAQHGTMGQFPGGLPSGMMGIVGEEGRELVWLPQGAHVIPNDETERTLALMGGGGNLPGFQGGTGGTLGVNSPPATSGGSLGVGGGINVDAFVDVGMSIGDSLTEGINLALQAGLIDLAEITGAEMADAMITGAIMKIEAEGEGAIDQWRVNLERLPGIAAEIGNDTIVALLDEFQQLEKELKLAEIAGEDLEEIGAKLDAIEHIFHIWAGDTVASVEEVWDAVLDAAKAAEAEALWESIIGAIQMPSAPISFGLEDLIGGDAIQQLQDDFHELWDLQKIFEEAGLHEQAAAIGEQMAALGLQEEMINNLLGTDAAQDLIDQFAAQAEEADAATLWEQILSVPLEDLADGSFVEDQQAKLDELYADLSIAEALGLEDQAAAIQEDIEAQEDLLAAAGEAMATPVVEAAADVSLAGIAELTEIFSEFPDIAVDMIDDVIDAVDDGRIPFEDAMRLLAMVPEDELIPALEALEEQLTVDLAQALLSFGPDSPEVQAILASMGLIESAITSASESIDNVPNLNQKTGEVAEVSSGGGPVAFSGVTGLSTLMDALDDVPAGTRLQIMGSEAFDAALSAGAVLSIDQDGLRFPETGYEAWVSGGKMHVNPFAEGGIVTSPTMALLGDNPSGVEGVFPLERAGDFGFGGNTYNVTINAQSNDPNEIAEAVRFALMTMRTPGSAGRV